VIDVLLGPSPLLLLFGGPSTVLSAVASVLDAVDHPVVSHRGFSADWLEVVMILVASLESSSAFDMVSLSAAELVPSSAWTTTAAAGILLLVEDSWRNVFWLMGAVDTTLSACCVECNSLKVCGGLEELRRLTDVYAAGSDQLGEVFASESLVSWESHGDDSDDNDDSGSVLAEDSTPRVFLGSMMR
jgi:hypothetical protein